MTSFVLAQETVPKPLVNVDQNDTLQPVDQIKQVLNILTHKNSEPDFNGQVGEVEVNRHSPPSLLSGHEGVYTPEDASAAGTR